MKRYKLKIFCDFDGTVTKNDVWVASLGKFIKDKKKLDLICEEFSSLLITARECIRKELALVEDFNLEKFNSYLDKEELDDYFKEFLEFCRKNDFEVVLVSEGLDYYIDYILKRENLNLKFFSNKLVLNSSKKESNVDTFEIGCAFPYSDETCNWCGMSKRNILISNTNDLNDEVSVYIGDGVSDFCVSHYADIVFAKNALASHCWKNNITYFEYKTFKDVIKKLIKLIEQNKIKQKQTAKYNRRDVLLGG